MYIWQPELRMGVESDQMTSSVLGEGVCQLPRHGDTALHGKGLPKGKAKFCFIPPKPRQTSLELWQPGAAE